MDEQVNKGAGEKQGAVPAPADAVPRLLPKDTATRRTVKRKPRAYRAFDEHAGAESTYFRKA